MGRHAGGPGRLVAVRDQPPAAPSGSPSVTGGRAGGESYHRAVRLTARWYDDLVAAPPAAGPARQDCRVLRERCPVNMSHV
ncbi:hypothetical protein [Streptomyces sp. NPDC059651]|uniref:hypothetical protein n=1 Tax=Streptomyces sp. NPDC059651 TaxID=3346897 RepID=UPI0036A1A29E